MAKRFKSSDENFESDRVAGFAHPRETETLLGQGAALELDMPGTIRGTGEQAGMLDLHWMPERHNAVKVLMLLDVGGSMDDHIARIESLFSAARSEFRHLEVYYFHNCPYESVWRHNSRRHGERKRSPFQPTAQGAGVCAIALK